VSEDIDVNEKHTQTREEIMGILACYEKILKKKKFLSPKISLLIFACHLQGFMYCHPYIWTMDPMIHMTHLPFMRKHLLLKF